MLILAAFVVIVAGMKVASPLIVPILLSMFIATISAPPLLWLESKGLPTPLALLVVIGIILGAGLLIVTLVGASLAEFQIQLPVYEQRLEGLFTQVNALAATFEISLDFADLASVINPTSVATAVGKLVQRTWRSYHKRLFDFSSRCLHALRGIDTSRKASGSHDTSGGFDRKAV